MLPPVSGWSPLVLPTPLTLTPNVSGPLPGLLPGSPLSHVFTENVLLSSHEPVRLLTRAVPENSAHCPPGKAGFAYDAKVVIEVLCTKIRIGWLTTCSCPLI